MSSRSFARSSPAESAGAARITRERLRQLEAPPEGEGYDPEHDLKHDQGELLSAALAYARLVEGAHPETARLFWWPWAKTDWRPSPDPIRNLEKAGALIAAEIDRRLALAPETEPD
jgi:hypothetical protein